MVRTTLRVFLNSKTDFTLYKIGKITETKDYSMLSADELLLFDESTGELYKSGKLTLIILSYPKTRKFLFKLGLCECNNDKFVISVECDAYLNCRSFGDYFISQGFDGVVLEHECNGKVFCIPNAYVYLDVGKLTKVKGCGFVKFSLDHYDELKQLYGNEFPSKSMIISTLKEYGCQKTELAMYGLFFKLK